MENIARYIPGLSGEKLAAEVVRFESRILEIAQANLDKGRAAGALVGTIVAMPGARELLVEVRCFYLHRSTTAAKRTRRGVPAGRS